MTFQKPFEEWAACREDRFVGFDTFILTRQGDIAEVTVTSQISKRCLHNILEIVPLQTQLLIFHRECWNDQTTD